MNRRQWLATTSALVGGTYFGFKDCAYSQELAPVRSNRTVEGMIKLSSNENPNGPSEKARKAMAEAFDIAQQYPRASIAALERAIAKHENLSTDHVIIGAGSYELLSLVTLARLRNGGNVVAPDPTFWAIMSYGQQFGAGWRRAPVDENFKMDLARLEKQINKETKIVYVCNPNNPTGTFIDNDLVGQFCTEASKKSLVVADEAYLEFVEHTGQKSIAPLVEKNSSMLVAKTFSKIYGLAGLRVGYGLAHPDLIRELKLLQTGQGVGISAVSATGALASYRDKELIQQSLTNIGAARKRLNDYLSSAGIKHHRSVTNFMCIDPGKFGAGMIDELRKRKVLVRNAKAHGKDWTRVSITTEDDIAFFIAAHSRIVASAD